MNRCPGCSRAGDDVGKCGRSRTCPVTNGQPAPEIDPKKDVVIRCNRCEITRSVSVNTLMAPHGSARQEMEHHCPLGADSCQAFLMQPQKVAKVGKPTAADAPEG